MILRRLYVVLRCELYIMRFEVNNDIFFDGFRSWNAFKEEAPKPQESELSAAAGCSTDWYSTTIFKPTLRGSHSPPRTSLFQHYCTLTTGSLVIQESNNIANLASVSSGPDSKAWSDL